MSQARGTGVRLVCDRAGTLGRRHVEAKDWVLPALARTHEMVHRTVEGLTPRQLAYRPGPEANSVAWIVWHLTRGLDRRASSMDGGEQTWIADGWHERFGLPADASDFGIGHTSEQVDAVRPGDGALLAGYYDAVYERMGRFVEGVQGEDLARPVATPAAPNAETPLGQELVNAIVGNLMHAAQAAYVRGLIEQRRWWHR